MTLVILTGPPAVGKMTVGQALEACTDLVLCHNHMTIDLVLPFFDYGTKEGSDLVGRLRREVFRAVAQSEHPGMIFTYVWAFDTPSEAEYVNGLAEIFKAEGRPVYVVELETSQQERLARNRSANRLAHKPSKRNVEASDAHLLELDKGYRMNSEPGELEEYPNLRLDNTHMPPEEAAARIKAEFNL